MRFLRRTVTLTLLPPRLPSPSLTNSLLCLPVVADRPFSIRRDTILQSVNQLTEWYRRAW